MKARGGGGVGEWSQSIHFDKLSYVGKCPFPALKGQHHESSIKHILINIL
jgi:hypothetical protein